jgi:hypothetical protein
MAFYLSIILNQDEVPGRTPRQSPCLSLGAVHEIDCSLE